VRPKRSDVLQELGGATHVCEGYRRGGRRDGEDLPVDLRALTSVVSVGQIIPDDQLPEVLTSLLQALAVGWQNPIRILALTC